MTTAPSGFEGEERSHSRKSGRCGDRLSISATPVVKEALDGFHLIEAADLDQALAEALRGEPGEEAAHGPVGVEPVVAVVAAQLEQEADGLWWEAANRGHRGLLLRRVLRIIFNLRRNSHGR